MQINKKKQTILIVDDMTTNLLILSDLLKDEYSIKVAKNGQKALDIVHSSDEVDIILLDIMMPDIDGYEVCRELKSNPKTKNIPIIFVTAKDNDADEEYGLNLGAIDYITKPFNKAIVKLRIKNHLELKLKSDLLEELSMYDGLTHIPNRRFFDEVFQSTYKEVKRENKSLAVMMIDIDFFKLYNDNYGHGKGDETLKKVAQALQMTLKRPTDLVARYGGEEFIVLLKDIGEENVKKVALNLLQAVQELQITHEYSKVEQIVTISIGVAYKTASSLINKVELLICADKALYDVKRTSRNNFHIINV
ncbi:MAG: diguanylate cyclase [Arcobacteraceae bacterium]|jgi:diguanylate cyclase (GGDEF)-like protein|nr:diguanylate cyclase [Arcobacteraceae bacterium]